MVNVLDFQCSGSIGLTIIKEYDTILWIMCFKFVY